MLTSEERQLVYDRGCVPEHLPEYVQSVSDAEPFIHEGYLCFFGGGHLIFVGYPLDEAAPTPRNGYESTLNRFRPRTVAVISANTWLSKERLQNLAEDQYFRLDLPLDIVDPRVGYMVRRAEREVLVSDGSFGTEHERIVQSFLERKECSSWHEEIFSRIPRYLSRSPTARLLEARRESLLTAFSVLDLGSRNYGFYMFNFRSSEIAVPGASDLLLREMARVAWSEGKKSLNLGLGISPGVRRFKEKWGAVPFLAYTSVLVRTRSVGLLSLLAERWGSGLVS